MELVDGLLVTAIAAFIVSFVVARLVAIATAGDGERGLTASARAEKAVGEVKLSGIEELRVRSTESESKFQFANEIFEKQDEIEGAISVAKAEESVCSGQFEEKLHDSGVTCDSAVGTQVVAFPGLSDNSSEGTLTEEAAVVGSDEIRQIEGEDVVSDLDGVAVVEGKKGAEGDEITIVEQGNVETRTGLLIEETIVENKEAKTAVVASFAIDDTVLTQGENQVTDVEEKMKERIVDSEEDDWEGIERSELEEVFAAAVNYVASGGKGDGLSGVSREDYMRLYGLHKVAMEGPCHDPQPMALKLSARGRWNAWQRLGNISPETAMEQYITMLSDKVPGWMEGKSSKEGKTDSSESGVPAAPYPCISAYPRNEHNPMIKGNLDLTYGPGGGD
ncbi:hypothetical protein NMG60_11031225 [Bertholletia excelsa]